MWSDLSILWQYAFGLAWEAYYRGSIPIGAVLLDKNGNLLTSGRNQTANHDDSTSSLAGNQFAHSETNALLKAASLDKDILPEAHLYTTMEPCPLCMGFLYMSGVRNLHYAARDGYADSANLLGTTWYLSLKPIKAHLPENDNLEVISLALNVLHLFGRNPEQNRGQIYSRWMETFPKWVRLG